MHGIMTMSKQDATLLADSPILLSPSAASEGLQLDSTTSPYKEPHLCLLGPFGGHQLERVPV